MEGEERVKTQRPEGGIRGHKARDAGSVEHTLIDGAGKERRGQTRDLSAEIVPHGPAAFLWGSDRHLGCQGSVSFHRPAHHFPSFL